MVDGPTKAPGGALLLIRLALSGLFLWGLYWLFNGGAATTIEGLDHRFPRSAPGPDAALAKTRLSAPFILAWTAEWGAKVESAAAAVHGDEPAPPEFFVLGVTPESGDSMTGIFFPGRSPGASAFVDLTFLEDVAGRVQAGAGLVPLYLLSSAAGLRRGTLEGAKRVDQADDLALRVALYGDWVAGAAMRMAAEGSFPKYGPEDVARVVQGARAAEESLESTRPLGWTKPTTFRTGSHQQRTRWFLKGYEGTGTADDVWTAALQP